MSFEARSQRRCGFVIEFKTFGARAQIMLQLGISELPFRNHFQLARFEGFSRLTLSCNHYVVPWDMSQSNTRNIGHPMPSVCNAAEV